MELLTLLARHAGDRLKWLVALLLLSSLCGVSILAIVNEGIDERLKGEDRYHLLVLGAGATVVYMMSHLHVMRRIARYFEEIIIDLRRRLLTRLRHAEYLQVQNLDPAEFQSGISAEMRTISYGSAIIPEMLHSIFMITIINAYLFLHSPLAALSCMAFIAVSVFIVASRRVAAEDTFAEACELENELLGHVGDMIDGFKEVRMEPSRADQISVRVMEVADRIAAKKEVALGVYARSVVETQCSFNTLILFVIFVLPQITDMSVGLFVVASSLLFISEPMLSVVSYLPSLMAANTAARNILDLERRLPEPRITAISANPSCFDNFQEIHFKDVIFGHRTHDGGEFWIGPVNLSIDRGKIILVTGGNGSGKSTLLRTLIGLYRVYSGTITVDSMVVEPDNLPLYRRLFAVVFSDGHLFQELYGIQHIDMELAQAMFEFLEIGHKANITDRRFSTVRLSGGQRKRLSLIAAILEKKPICVLDEWAADQEPYFRDKFYREVLPRLRDMGMTVVAITHDRDYLEVGDVHWHVEAGMIVSVTGENRQDRKQDIALMS
ncbi:hypothetical protein N825_33885 [Skermanella stibiiresistens SB22]|uniref:ATP-binding cassette transporter n=1 Tax=Skermanella stibiiresistens SB22 TaxID=1385369 RepID=W9H3Z7_9PROT|nr:ATP-binding cassette domain-containing protein [Skermanella stibiiresistens]EWY40925.1 hypothetical protein N825_33885 [Skermanella stibiiresistens SB22]